MFVKKSAWRALPWILAANIARLCRLELPRLSAKAESLANSAVLQAAELGRGVSGSTCGATGYSSLAKQAVMPSRHKFHNKLIPNWRINWYMGVVFIYTRNAENQEAEGQACERG